MHIDLLNPADHQLPVAVITGGWSQERDRSLLSGAAVTDELTAQGIKTRVVDLSYQDLSLSEELSGCATAFLAIAGRGAEDGRLQGLLETLGLDYTGSGVLASALGMNKLAAKVIVAGADVQVAPGSRIDARQLINDEAERVAAAFGFPLIIKPVQEGGSIGLAVAAHPGELEIALTAVTEQELMVERLVPGRSVTVGVLEDENGKLHVLPALEAATTDGIYTYTAKRSPNGATYHCPARVSNALHRTLADQAKRAHQALGCHGYSRHDFVVSEESGAVWLEVNTLPGLTHNGNLARMATAAGISFGQLIAHILRGASTDRRAQP
ncbi:D-alanine--D-alanine ligase [Streptomyces sp. NPDC006703]|uniref:D-alanine--D-alanine ligase family protein n=1 Tax=Streptomyces sp. NPDC006703 TaxID=3364759 RepID=UPI00369F84C5